MNEDFRILYVDDEQDNLFTFKSVFRRIYAIDLANSGEEGLKMLEENHYDLVISDQRMPEMTGVGFLKIVKDKYPDILRIVMTGYADIEVIIQAVNEGEIYRYIKKPWKAEELKISLKNVFENLNLKRKNKDLERQNVNAQFDILKNRINPHFLFNSMNALSALIRKDANKAIQFTNSFAKLYRSVLQLKEQHLISLAEELSFVKEYFVLQKIRFEENLVLDISIPENKLNDSLPPFGLQILLENAVKHNAIQVGRPLHIKIQYVDEALLVENNIQAKAIPPPASGHGLANLKSRYALLGIELQNPINDGQTYQVRLPLIPNG